TKISLKSNPKPHHRIHNIKLYVPKHGVYVEMQATLNHSLYELFRTWKPKNSGTEEELKQPRSMISSTIQKITDRYKAHSDIVVLKPPQLSKKTETEINSNMPLKMAKFTYDQLCNFTSEKIKGKAIYVVLYEYYKKYIIGDKNPASCADFTLLLQEARKLEMKEDITLTQALETYIPLQANNYPHVDGDETFNCHQCVIEFLREDEKKKFITNKMNKISFFQALQGKNISKEIMDVIHEKMTFIFIMDGFDEIFDVYSKSDRFNLSQ
ncbi:hypothetical protein RFI_31673, partial [Reticulomyxa filosa]